MDFESSWSSLLDEFRNKHIAGFWTIPVPPIDLRKYIERTKLQQYGLDLPTGFVPASTYWLVQGEDIVAHLNIRHELTPLLRRVGGHIGYAVRPSMWRMGYGTKALEMALPVARQIGLNRVLVTCDHDNVASQKIIEANGGIYEGSTSEVHDIKLRYWIDLSENRFSKTEP